MIEILLALELRNVMPAQLLSLLIASFKVLSLLLTQKYLFLRVMTELSPEEPVASKQVLDRPA